jgi:hypothetical protein
LDQYERINSSAHVSDRYACRVDVGIPGLRHWQIYGKARHLRLYKVRSAFKPTGFPVIDEIRARALKLRLSMVDLDALARTKRYFQQAGWHGSGLNGKAICRAIEVLDGEPWPRWRE